MGVLVVLVLAERGRRGWEGGERERESKREWASRSLEGWKETNDEKRRDPGEFDWERKRV